MIRLGKQEDLKQIDVFDEFGGDRKAEIFNQSLKVYVLKDKVVGYISVIEESDLFGHPLISFLCVHPQYRRQGIASELLKEIETQYIKQQLFISTESNNSIMLGLIKKRKYTLSGSLAGLNEDNK